MITKTYKNINGHIVFSDSVAVDADYPMSGFKELFENEQKHFWFITRKNLIASFMQKYVKKRF